MRAAHRIACTHAFVVAFGIAMSTALCLWLLHGARSETADSQLATSAFAALLVQSRVLAFSQGAFPRILMLFRRTYVLCVLVAVRVASSNQSAWATNSTQTWLPPGFEWVTDLQVRTGR